MSEFSTNPWKNVASLMQQRKRLAQRRQFQYKHREMAVQKLAASQTEDFLRSLDKYMGLS